MDVTLLTQVVAISFIVMQFVETLVKPILDIINAALHGEPVRQMVLDLWPMYVTVAVGGALGWFAHFNLLPMFEPAVIGRVLTAIGIGLGPTFLYDTFQDHAWPPAAESSHSPDEVRYQIRRRP